LFLASAPPQPGAPQLGDASRPPLVDATGGERRTPAKAEPVKAEVAPPDGSDEPAPLPAPVTRKALCGELTRTAKEVQAAKKRLEDERRALENERRELDKLKSEIAASRASLRAETEKLEALLAKREAQPDSKAAAETPRATATAAPPPASRPQELDALAKTLKSMKPEAAAAVIQRSEPLLAAALLKRMKPADAGAVMERLKPEQATELAALMSTLPSPPKPGARL
jgi:flagellar motility protein MotE (MotC chaperone)